LPFFKRNEFEVVIDKNTHLLVLDQKWHELFKGKKPTRIGKLEKELNVLLKKQGAYTTELKEYRKLKKKLMGDIVQGMSDAYDASDKIALKQMGKNKKYVEDINRKIEHHETELSYIPEKIADKNRELVTATMNHFYHTMISRKERASALEDEVIRLKEEIKEAIIERDEAKEYYQQLYGYMHDVVGNKVIEQYDRHYQGEQDD